MNLIRALVTAVAAWFAFRWLGHDDDDEPGGG